MFIIIHYFFYQNLKGEVTEKKTIDEYTFEAKEIKDSITKIVEKIDTELKVAKDEYTNISRKFMKIIENFTKILSEI